MFITEQTGTLPLYTPPRLRVSAKYAAGATETVDIELGDADTPITGAFVADLVAALIARPATDRAPSDQVSRPLVTWTPSLPTTTTTTAVPVATTYTVQNGGSQ